MSVYFNPDSTLTSLASCQRGYSFLLVLQSWLSLYMAESLLWLSLPHKSGLRGEGLQVNGCSSEINTWLPFAAVSNAQEVSLADEVPRGFCRNLVSNYGLCSNFLKDLEKNTSEYSRNLDTVSYSLALFTAVHNLVASFCCSCLKWHYLSIVGNVFATGV